MTHVTHMFGLMINLILKCFALNVSPQRTNDDVTYIAASPGISRYSSSKKSTKCFYGFIVEDEQTIL